MLIYPMTLKSFMEPYGGGEADYRGLGQFPFIHHSPESSTRKMTEAFLERERMVFRNTITADNIFIMKELVRRGAGISMVPASFLEEGEQGIGVLSVPGTELRKEIVLIAIRSITGLRRRNVFWSVWEIGNIPEKAHNLGVRPKPVLWEAVMNSQKLENLLNLSLDSTMEERENHGY